VQFDPNDEGVEAWEFSTPSAFPEGEGERVPFDERSTVEIQMEIERLERGDVRERRVWSLIALTLFAVLVVTPGDIASGAATLGLILAGFASTAVGLLRVRRHQLRRALEDELEARRREEIDVAESPAHRLAVLRDALDRLEDRPSGWLAVALGALAALIFVVLGLVFGVELGVVLGGFFGLFTALAAREERRQLADATAMKEEVRAIEARRELPSPE